MSGKTIGITVPCEPMFLGIVRLAASAAATIANMDIEDDDDVRIASDELCYLLMSAEAGGDSLHIEFELDDQRLIIRGERASWPVGATIPGASELMVKILSKVVDDFEITAGDGSVSFRALKAPSRQSSAK
jgi:hypothetical protein